MGKNTWRTQEGVEIEIKDMSDQHLVNSVRMLERNAETLRQRELSAGYQVWGMLQGEQANWDIERDISQLEEMPALEFLEGYMPIYKTMKWHIRRRGLKI